MRLRRLAPYAASSDDDAGPGGGGPGGGGGPLAWDSASGRPKVTVSGAIDSLPAEEPWLLLSLYEWCVWRLYDSIAKAYLVQWLGSAPKWEDEKSLRRLLRSNPQPLMVPANELDANDPLLLEYSRYETSGGRARTAAKNATKAIQINVDQLEQASDAEEDEQDDAPPTQRARNARTATISIDITVNLQPFLQCPISHEIMVDPVVAEDGHTYEREALARWLHVNNTSPMTGKPMGTRMVPNHAVKSMIANLSSTSA